MEVNQNTIDTLINNFKSVGFDDYTFLTLLLTNYAVVFMPESTDKVTRKLASYYSDLSKLDSDVTLARMATLTLAEKAEGEEGLKGIVLLVINIACSHLKTSFDKEFLNRVINDLKRIDEKGPLSALQSMLGI